MTLTISNVEQWQPGQLSGAATHANTISLQLDGLSGKAVTDTQALGWSGTAGAAATARMENERTRTGKVSAALLLAETAFAQEIDNLNNAKQKVLEARDAARAPQPPLPDFEVADDGTVNPQARIDYLRQVSEGADDSPETQKLELGQRLLAANLQWSVTTALKNAETVANTAKDKLQQAITALETAYNELGDPAANTAPAAVDPTTTPAATNTDGSGGSTSSGSSGSGSGSSGGYSGASGSGGYSGTGGSGGSSSSLMGDGSAGSSGSSGGYSTSAPTEMPSGEQAEWIQKAIAELRANGYDISDSDAAIIAMMIQHESGGDPNAINLWDSNAAAGIPSKGLMQTIDPTFNSYALPGHNDIWNPVDNIIAGTRYAIDRYGSLSNVPGVVGVNQGTGYVGY